MNRASLALALWMLGTGPAVAALPDPVKAMIEAVAGDAAALKAVADAARKTNPGSEAEIDALLAEIAARSEAEREARLANQGFFDGWSGEGQAGFFASSGNVSDTGLAVGVTLKKESRHWRHGLEAVADFQRTEGVTTRERFLLGYSGNWKFSERAYAWVLLSAERDRFAGFNSRFSQGLGLGYRLVDSKRLRIDVEGGPALRQTNFITEPNENSLAARLAGTLAWDVSDTTLFTQNVGMFLESGNSTLTSVSALTAKIGGALSARASFDIRHETSPPPLRESTDTTTRFTLVYGF